MVVPDTILSADAELSVVAREELEHVVTVVP